MPKALISSAAAALKACNGHHCHKHPFHIYQSLNPTVGMFAWLKQCLNRSLLAYYEISLMTMVIHRGYLVVIPKFYHQTNTNKVYQQRPKVYQTVPKLPQVACAIMARCPVPWAGATSQPGAFKVTWVLGYLGCRLKRTAP